jgi:hypothetical protein
MELISVDDFEPHELAAGVASDEERASSPASFQVA